MIRIDAFSAAIFFLFFLLLVLFLVALAPYWTSSVVYSPSPNYLPLAIVKDWGSNHTGPLIIGGCDVWCFVSPSESYNYSCQGRGETFVGFEVSQYALFRGGVTAAAITNPQRTYPMFGAHFSDDVRLVNTKEIVVNGSRAFFRTFTDSFKGTQYTFFELSWEENFTARVIQTDTGCVGNEQAQDEIVKVAESMR